MSKEELTGVFRRAVFVLVDNGIGKRLGDSGEKFLKERRVLALFVQQAAIWSPGLDGGNPGWRDLVHTIKGAALGIGANALGAAAASAEAASAPDLEPVRAALAAALAEIADYRSEA